ncbi:hypothetical protein [Bacillus sp. FJAT-49736]|uniref:hypothetical protein n=1 Tax=Bacillus sp. FJAT-49736 TaxID=2833582 RepID=UPI001BCA3C29|nr:hypothetical protein [Bacillus sp. FJAT-49736]MBS4172106.1 hypothetical protein [Bacillus sp. FJAT-49736]
MRKPLKDQLKQWEKKHKEIIRNNREMNKKRKSEHLSEEDIKELMGINRTIYRRCKGGAWRNR